MKEQEDEQVRCFIAFFDIRGFGSFERRVNDAKTELLPWRKQWRKIIDDFQKRTGYYEKRIGDGGMIVHETVVADAWYDVTKFLDNCWSLLMQFKALRRKKESPRYDGDIIRVSYGAIWREPSEQMGKDYYGFLANLTEQMIHQHKETCFVLTQGCVELVTKYNRKKSGYKFKLLCQDKNVLCDPIYADEMKHLYSFQKRKVK